MQEQRNWGWVMSNVDSRITHLSNELAKTQVLLEQAADNQAELAELVHELAQSVTTLKEKQEANMRRTVKYIAQLEQTLNRKGGSTDVC